MNLSDWRPGEPLEEGDFCWVFLAEDHRGRIPAHEDFFDSHKVAVESKKKMQALLRQHARTGPSPSREKYKRFGDLHYLKIFAFRAYCYQRELRGRRELIVCNIYPKKSDSSLPDEYEIRAKRTFHEHCERHPQ